MTRRGGFTLVEVLVALAIVAIGLAAAVRAVGLATDATRSVRERQLALFVAQNRLAEHSIHASWPDAGARSGDAEQAGLAFRWQEDVSATPNPLFRRIEVRVALAGAPEQVLATLTGYAARGR